jgi:hypothetical protein
MASVDEQPAAAASVSGVVPPAEPHRATAAVAASPAKKVKVVPNLLGEIEALKAEQKKIKDEKKKVTKTLKNAQRRKKRLQTRARQLTNDDLMAVLMMREKGGEEQETDAINVDATGSAEESSEEMSG